MALLWAVTSEGLHGSHLGYAILEGLDDGWRKRPGDVPYPKLDQVGFRVFL